jgi:hypothetical protein
VDCPYILVLGSSQVGLQLSTYCTLIQNIYIKYSKWHRITCFHDKNKSQLWTNGQPFNKCESSHLNGENVHSLLSPFFWKTNEFSHNLKYLSGGKREIKLDDAEGRAGQTRGRIGKQKDLPAATLSCFLPPNPSTQRQLWLRQQNLQKIHLLVEQEGGGRNARFSMGRSRKDALALDGSGDPAPADLEGEDVEEEQNLEEGDGEEDGEEEEEDGEEASGEMAVQDKAEEGSPPKLAEGFFEIEAIRRRRSRRGQLQYLVKW